FAYKTRERSENIACHLRPACREAQSRQRDHGVASPIVEPGISGQNRLRIRRAIERARGNELIRREYKLLDCWRSIAPGRDVRREKSVEQLDRFALAFRKRCLADERRRRR